MSRAFNNFKEAQERARHEDLQSLEYGQNVMMKDIQETAIKAIKQQKRKTIRAIIFSLICWLIQIAFYVAVIWLVIIHI